MEPSEDDSAPVVFVADIPGRSWRCRAEPLAAREGDAAAAVAYLREGLAVAAEIGDRPIALEMVVTMAVLGEQLGHNGRSLTLLAFALQQPELFAETRKTAVAHYAAMQKKYTQPQIAAAETAAKNLDFQTALSQLFVLMT